MKIERIETLLDANGAYAVVRITTDDGAEGYGQTSPFEAGLTADILHRMVAPFFLGKDPWDLERLVERCLNETYKFPSTFILRALCGIDTAIWDLLGKVTGQPVYRLLGGLERANVPVYASSMRRDITPEEEADRLAGEIDEHGYRCVKIRIGDKMGNDRDASPGRTERLIPHMRDVLGDDIAINADANGGYSPAQAIRVGRLLEQHGYHHFEEPCPYTQLENTTAVTAALDIPVAGGEQDTDPAQFLRMIEMRAVDIVQPDIGYIGGIGRARDVAAMAHIAGIPCTPHSSGRTMLRVFTLHLAAAMPSCSQFQEWTIEPPTAGVPLFEPELKVIDGMVRVPDGPGWGVTITSDFLATAQHRASVA